MPAFFSIIIPSFNRANFIKDTINTILTQTFDDFEIIFVDDGSTDNTEEVVRNITDKRLRYFKKINEERSIARNFGIERAIGQYINFLDSDDRFYADHLETAYAFIESKNFPEVCHLGFETININGEVLSKREDFEDLKSKMANENIMHCNAIFIKRQIALEFPFINNRDAIISEDWYVWLRLTSRFKIHTNNIITSAVVEHEARSLNNIDVDKLIKCVELIIKKLKEDKVFLLSYKYRANIFFSNQYSFVMLLLSLNKRRSDFIVYAVKTLRENIFAFVTRRFLAALKYFIFPFLIR